MSADDCDLSQEDHYHIHRATVSMEPLRRLSKAARKALNDLRKDPYNDDAISRFQGELRPLMSKEPATGSPEAGRRVTVDRRVTIEDCSWVQTGDGSTMYKTNKYVAEVTELPIVDLFVKDKELVRTFVQAMNDPNATSSFYRHVATAAEKVDELTRLAQAPDLQQIPETDMCSFFGFASVKDATAVMVGFGNRFDVATKIDLPPISEPTVIKDINKLRLRQPPPPTPPAHDEPRSPDIDHGSGGLGFGGMG